MSSTVPCPAGAEKSQPAGTVADAAEPEAGRSSGVFHWQRRPLGYSYVVRAGDRHSGIVTDFIGAGGELVSDPRVALHVRRRLGPQQDVITVTLINEEIEVEGEGGRDARCLFQTELVIRSLVDGKGMIQPRPHMPVADDDEDALTNALLYRRIREFAVGHGVGAAWDDPRDESVAEVRTSWLPVATVSGTSPAGHASLRAFLADHPKALHADFLGNEADREEVVRALGAFVDCYGSWIDSELRSRAGHFSGALAAASAFNLARCESTLVRIRAGVDCLRNDAHAWTAFALANAAMDRQSRFPSKGVGARSLVWRPFQLAFMLLVIPGLIDPKADSRQCMDLLWFPTGGGKTEAYLALTAFQIFHRRLVDDRRRENGGVDVLMRYTLRLLTVQQFQRAAALVAACELIRVGDARLGSARISLGLYVGSDTTPLSMDSAREALLEEQADRKPKSTPRQLLRCPVCGTDLRAADYQADPARPVIEIRCRNAECETFGSSLPVMTVDEEIYHAPPSLLIGTIDKFAQIPRRTDIRRIFGLDGGLPPGLIIQDELHLISGPLGSMAGLYESIIDSLCTRDGDRPKVIGSTATIGQAAKQVRALFDRNVLQFPPPGFDASDSFFAVRDEIGPDRMYVGLPTSGRSPKFALQALLAALLQSARAMLDRGTVDDDQIDTYWTVVAYFNSLRELGGAYVLVQDDVPRQIQFLAGRLGTSRRDLEHEPEELSSRKSSRELPKVLDELGTTLSMHAENPNEFAQPKDVVLASNMISVGVDVPRLGLMVVNGQPKSTAEYIQASSRVGRLMPGLVFTLYNVGRPRDLSHFEHFRTYHSALYRSVEATSVTPWAPRARDKALHAVVASLVRHLIPGLAGEEDAIRFDPAEPRVAEIIQAVIDRVAAAADPIEVADTAQQIEAIIEEWARRSSDSRGSSMRLTYWHRKAPFGRAVPHLMHSAEEGSGGGALSWSTPNSMREVEPSTAFVLKSIQRRSGEA
ncbi:helicase-related protein [Piscinibacterium candidicorallinum]|uniref:Helicase-related protein n=1 Tax=Piscinibacterium candidicorallinum TaxID=1793872 RepID=A0ABV7H466_9BURK